VFAVLLNGLDAGHCAGQLVTVAVAKIVLIDRGAQVECVNVIVCLGPRLEDIEPGIGAEEMETTGERRVPRYEFEGLTTETESTAKDPEAPERNMLIEPPVDTAEVASATLDGDVPELAGRVP
jgi:hypothetical protein